jgi:anthranilate phosphoribosyltransferase
MFPALLEKLAQQLDLTTAEAEAAMEEIMAGRASPAQTAALLVGLRSKGERPAEIVGFARTMRRHAVPIAASGEDVFDTCGTGGDGAGTFNVSSVVALVLAGCGVRVAKHGNRAVSSQCGSADVFEALGVVVTASPPTVERSLRDAGIGFFFAPTFHPSMRHAAPTRKELGIRTAFNLLGPLTNPAGAVRQLVGVPRPEMTELLARALALLGSRHAWVVHGADGLDEIATAGYTKVSESRDGYLRTFYIHPSEFGIPKSPTAALQGGGAAVNARLALDVLEGRPGPLRDVTLLNAGAALFVAGRAASVPDGIAEAARAIDAGRAGEALRRMVELSKAEVVA